MAFGRVIDPNGAVLVSRLETRLRWQSRWITAVLAIGLPVCMLGIILGLTSIGAGLPSGSWKFITRGIAWIAMSAILIVALLPLIAVQSNVTSSALSEMMDLAIDRAQGTLWLVRGGLCACAIAATSSLVPIAFRTHFARPPRVSAIVVVEILALIASALVFCSWRVGLKLRKYRALRQATVARPET